jgi:hypothetical protein
MLDLQLYGPYRSISADGSFAIQVEGLKKSKNAGGDMFWDCYSDKAVYDKFLTQDIGSIAKVSYVVLSNAVETSVQVQLKLPPPGIAARVHGEITAHYEGYKNHCILLFSRTEDKKMELEVPSSDDYINVPIPLQRAVIAAPVGLSLRINVNIHVVFPPTNDNAVAICDHLVLNLEGGEKGKFLQGDVEMHVRIGPPTSSSIGAILKQSNTSPSTALVPG